MSDDDAYVPTVAGVMAASMSADAQWASITDDGYAVVAALRKAARDDDWGDCENRPDPAKLRRIAMHLEERLPVVDEGTGYAFAAALRRCGLGPRDG